MYSLEQVRNLFGSYWLDNEGIKKAITQCNDKTGYIIDPHGAIGYKAWDDIRSKGFSKDYDFNLPGITPNVPEWASKISEQKGIGVILETAHPAKFGSIVAESIGREPPVPGRLLEIMNLPDRAIQMENDYGMFKDWLINNL
ncbi:MAG: hypothetical protein HUJ54_13615 [Erysipelotrichaceae bacterium]|nr:hypothetical protein [Erysipelotrichaceae bacterium]